jgi:hypothetical protein
VFYNCSNCPGYCCTYHQIPVSRADIRRLARRFELDEDAAHTRFTKPAEDGKGRVMRHREDEIFQTACRFLHPEKRRCTIYEHRPHACRSYPGTPRCGYYDFLMAERNRQDDDDLIVSAWVADT